MEINGDRLWRRLMQMAEIGAIAGNGVNRQALSSEEIASWHLMIRWAQASDLHPCTDAFGNLFIVLAGRDRLAPPLLLGSHLDSQPTGGRFDGVYGVLAALEVLVRLRETGYEPACDVVAVAWMNEEGSRFAPGMMGSAGFAGARSLNTIRSCRDAEGISVGQALDALHAATGLPTYACMSPPAAYLEAHIEQATQLEQAQSVIGVVRGIQGKYTWQVTLNGESGHAGTVPMPVRRDALAAFTRIAQALYQQVEGTEAAALFTIGWLTLAPNAPSVIPHRVQFRIDLRHPDAQVLQRLALRCEAIISQQAAPCEVQLEGLSAAPPNAFDPGLQTAIAEAAIARGYPAMPVLSAAGHDARYLAAICPSAMIFIPCREGISHEPTEWAEPAHVSAGGQVLMDVTLQWLMKR